MHTRFGKCDFKIDAVKSIQPEKNIVYSEHNEYHYEVLILCSGLHPKKDSIKGLQEALDSEEIPVASNYFMETAEKMNRLRK